MSEVSFDSGGAALRRASTWRARTIEPSPARTAGAPAWCSPTASAARSTPASSPSPSASRRPASMRSRSTTGTSARATVSPGSCCRSPRQLEDYAAAIAFARSLEGVDPDRIVVWGSSYSGGHVVPVAVADGRVAAVISQVPGMDGLATLVHACALRGPRPARTARAGGGARPRRLARLGARR